MPQQSTRRSNPRQIDLTNRRFGRWIALYEVERLPGQPPKWVCRCDCGKEGVVYGGNLRNGYSKSCGCYASEQWKRPRLDITTHGMTNTREYSVWIAMRRRCHQKGDTSYPYYGGQGITVCDLWRFSFSDFFRDMGPRPKGTSIDRIDNSLGYFPKNCRWATAKQQNNNKNDTIYLTHLGQTKCVSKWAEACGIPSERIHGRLAAGWSTYEALTIPVEARKARTPKTRKAENA